MPGWMPSVIGFGTPRLGMKMPRGNAERRRGPDIVSEQLKDVFLQ